MLTVFILASRNDERHVKDFWTHTAMLRRQIAGVTWANSLYIEDMVNLPAVVPAQAVPYIVIGCLSKVFLSGLLDEPALREIVAGAQVQIPLIISSCEWTEYPCPFAKKTPLIREAVAEVDPRQKDRVLAEAIGRLRPVVTRLAQEV